MDVNTIERMLDEIEAAEAAEAAERSAEAREQLSGALDPDVDIFAELRRFFAERAE